MARQGNTRREFLSMTGLGMTLGARAWAVSGDSPREAELDRQFFVRPEELTLKFRHQGADRRLSFSRYGGPAERWRQVCREKLVELLGYSQPAPCQARLLRRATWGGVQIEAWVMDVDSTLSVPAYFLSPRASAGKAVMAIHGHGEAEPCIGARDDYHHAFALKLAQAGYTVLCPALRGFGSLGDLARGADGYCLDYWKSRRGRQFTLVSDAFLYGRTLIGQTIEDLVRWETWLADTKEVRTLDAVGISYGGDLALMYPVFSNRVGKIYASGSLGSFAGIFSRCYNAPAHCIPGILRWMDRSDIAGLNAPRPIRLHYGQKDVPGPDNNSASYNETVEPALAELRTIYKALGAEDRITLHVTANARHEMDNQDLQAFLAR